MPNYQVSGDFLHLDCVYSNILHMGCCTAIVKRPSREEDKSPQAELSPASELQPKSTGSDQPHSRTSSKAPDDSKQTSADPKYVSLDLVPSRQEPEILPRVIEILPGQCGFIVEPGYLISTAGTLSSAERCRELLPSLVIQPDIDLFVCKELNFAIAALDQSRRPVGFVAHVSKLLTKSELLIGTANVTLEYIGESQLFYLSSGLSPGSPILFHRKVVGMHDSRHRGVSLLGICKQVCTLPQWHPFLEACRAEIQDSLQADKVWNLAGERLLSFHTNTGKFETYSTKIPSGAQISLIKDFLIITGGTISLTPVSTVRKFRTENYAYEDLKSMANSHSQHSNVLSLPQQLFVISGFSEGGITNECERYSMKKNQWLPIYPITRGRIDCGATEFQGSVYVYGGSGKGGRPVLEMEVFRNASWSDVLFQSSAPHIKTRLATDNKTILILGQQAAFWDLKRVRTLGKQASDLPGDTVYWRESSIYAFSGAKVLAGRLTDSTLVWTQHWAEALQQYLASES